MEDERTHRATFANAATRARREPCEELGIGYRCPLRDPTRIHRAATTVVTSFAFTDDVEIEHCATAGARPCVVKQVLRIDLTKAPGH
jgi:hypothetical protein